MDGDLDDITIFDTALDASEINRLYTGDWLNPLVPPALADYRFEEGSGLTAGDSNNGMDGTISGATFVTDSMDGSYSLNFDGTDDEVVIDHTSLLNITSALSLAAWIKTNDTNANQCIIGKNAAYYIYLYSGTYGSRIRTGLRINGSWIVFTSSNSSSNSIPANTWAHVAMTYDGNEIITYLNGADVGSTTQTGNLNTSSSDLELGTIWNSFRFSGLMDAVQIYDFALAPDEVEALAGL